MTVTNPPLYGQPAPASAALPPAMPLLGSQLPLFSSSAQPVLAQSMGQSTAAAPSGAPAGTVASASGPSDAFSTVQGGTGAAEPTQGPAQASLQPEVPS